MTLSRIVAIPAGLALAVSLASAALAAPAVAADPQDLPTVDETAPVRLPDRGTPPVAPPAPPAAARGVDSGRVPVQIALTPSEGERIGVGQLVTLSFSSRVERKAAVERAIHLTSVAPLPRGSWAWIDDQTAVYRPKRFWPGHARITFHIDLKGVVLARDGKVEYVGNRYADRDYLLKTSRSLVLLILDRTHRLYVLRDGKRVRSFPVSLGKPGYRTRSGTKILTGEKYRRLRMTGTDRFSNERWDVVSPYSIRLTPTGEFIHGAPWAYYRLGRANGSHGCTNMYVRDARWLFKRVRMGDPVVTKGTGRRMEVTNGIPGAYWNYRWAQWKEMSALH